MTPDQAMQAYMEATTWADLVRLSVGIMHDKVPSPFYGFIPVDEENEDNNWWGQGPRWEMLLQINQKGVITTEAQECDETWSSPVPEGWAEEGVIAQNCRVSLCCSCPRKVYDKLKPELEGQGLLVIEAWNNCAPNKVFSNAENIYADGRTVSLSSLHYEMTEDGLMTNYDNPLLDVVGDKMRTYLETKCVSFFIQDPIWNRPAHLEGGVFNTLLKLL